MSTIYTVDWTNFLAPDSELPTDVTFNVIQSSGTYRVKAHKLILAAVSPVFRRMFFANNENNFTTETEAIDITDSECFAFQKMINFIYSKVIFYISKTFYKYFYSGLFIVASWRHYGQFRDSKSWRQI